MKSITSASYSVHFNALAFAALNTHLEEAAYSKVFILVDENTHEHCLSILLTAIEQEYDFEIIEIESGEENKNIETCTQVWNVLSELGADRKSVVINLGGGVITDLGGFVAATYKRGIDFINIPTTLLAMVDASVGGKTGVDLGALKNQIGVIRQPVMVLVALIRTSVAIKNKVVLQDPTEQNLRKILNYGHTLGHAVESYFLESKNHELILHGEAIAIGMVLEGWLSHKLEGLQLSDLEDIKQTFAARYPKIAFTAQDIDTILSLLKFDKKNSHGNVNFVLLKEIGEPVIDVLIDENLLRDAFAYYSE